MGKSRSIESQQKANERFQEYVIKMQQDMDTHLSSIKSDISTKIKEHYEPYKDNCEIMLGEYTHLATLSEWSLDSISVIIDACKKSLFGGSIPDGSSRENVSEKNNAAIELLKSRELFIANEVFSIISGILTSPKSSTSTSILKKIDAKPIAPGMMLFIGVLENKFNHKDFFRNEKIIQDIYYYKVIFSIKEGENTSKIADLELFENQKITIRNQIERFNKNIDSLDPNDSEYDLDIQKIFSSTDIWDKRLKSINEKIKELSGGNSLKIASENDGLGNMIENLKEKCNKKLK